MITSQELPDSLTAAEVIELTDILLSNANSLRTSALVMLEKDTVPVARLLAILCVDTSGKAIALHERRTEMGYRPEGEPFVSSDLVAIWQARDRTFKLVHDFLEAEEYSFNMWPPNEEERGQIRTTLANLGIHIQRTVNEENTIGAAEGAQNIRRVLEYTEQIGWQLRLGEHIEARRRERVEEELAAYLRLGKQGKKFNNVDYLFDFPEDPFEKMGKKGHEAQDRSLTNLRNAIDKECGTD